MLPAHETTEREINGKLIEVVPYKGLPCDVEAFYIDERLIENFDKEDFGQRRDKDFASFNDSEDYYDLCCIDMVFERYDKDKDDYPKEIVEKAKEKYGLNDLEYDEVCLLLEEALHVGPCGWCK
jgi:hypothetical protein